ncbi:MULTISPECIES: efflux RND transporter permease subunit [Alteromonas]|jgi:hydrophobe/amphiphile efflux-1 (HAE1) family protein|nr:MULTISPECIES: efflux RND transporter permease subunit [Alteromonas]AFV84345.1 hydrophobe/amphiphile efflux-1 (HAE1) family transporter [Alteromonas mediterranea DE1]AGP80777.1 hydrophobe/amphiphile efflux-1 (HAE1) family transporter [Alteromonas mediterranea MED64]AGP96353.1 hydrophobe/amphiphile efflux-1 (HAE1) family transporter [Alteromonas mediterranea UM7]AGQ00687.1 hydrophobe/amphiphile efflux-1 (HAE1) family transporter [Alteromonas mediterranea UM4b]NQY18536.1 efflux RND transporter|tara:strand:+ start:1404 stop:4586 length:3183 start_codon:yes stop_codon:yes gene_type:complete
MFGVFIKRPVMAIMLSLMIIFLGALSVFTLPTSQFPDIAPPRVLISLAYPGSSADVLVKSSLVTIERSINGVPGMKYIVSDATSAGEATIQVIFDLDVDPNQALINVKTRLDQIMNRLPQLVQLEGVVLQRVQPSMLMYINVYSTDEDADEKFLYNYSNINVIPEIQRVNGIASAKILGSRQYAMRIWLKPDRMRAYNISVDEVMESIDEQSLIGRPGRLGRSSGISAQSKEYVLVYEGRYDEPDEYKNIIIRADSDGKLLKLSDIADVELSSEFFDIYSNKDGYPSAAIVLKQNYGSSANEVISQVKAKMAELEETFPEGMKYEINYDVSKFLDASIEQVLHTLFEAFILVSLVVFIFLGDWRSTLIPLLAVPVSLIGTFFCMQATGVNINLITLFALVLAIGIVVDNAIVIVEAVHAKMEESASLTPYMATQQVLGEMGGAIIAITLVMTAVFVPLVFMTGPVGVFYRQFSITMASSIIISCIVALSLTPVLCAMLLKNPHTHTKKATPISKLIDVFNRWFDKLTGGYTNIIKALVTRRVVTILSLFAFVAGTIGFNHILPTGFIPGEDQGQIYAIIQTPPGSTLEVTNEVARELQTLALDVEGVSSVSSLAGYEILTEGRGSNAGTCLINLKDWANRDQTVQEIIEELEAKTHHLGAVVEYFEPPVVPGYGASSGLSFRLLDKTNTTDYQEFDEINQSFMDELSKRKELKGLFTFYAANYPQYKIEIDNQAAMQKGVSIGKAMENLNILIGSTYEQGFTRFNNFYKVYTQSAPEYRRYPSDLMDYYVKNEEGEMVPYSAFMKLIKTQGPNEITRYNLYTSAAIRAEPAKGYTSAEAIKAVEEVAAATLPKGYDIGWEGLSFDEAKRGSEAIVIFGVVLLFVYIVLASQYESLLLPLAVILSLPSGLIGSFILLDLMGLANDVYAQLGLVMLVGLLGKNAVLIVEYAVQKNQQGLSIAEAAVDAAKQRFRPILMTSFSFVAGLIPLVIATGAGAVGNRTIGASALGGTLCGSVFGIIVIPGLYYLFAKLEEGKSLIKNEDHVPLTETYHYNDEVLSDE